VSEPASAAAPPRDTRKAYPLRAAISGVFLFAIGIALGAGLLYMNQQEDERLQGWERADGVVTDVTPIASGDRVLQRTAFVTASGERISITLSTTRRAAAAVNETVTVFYPPEDPQRAVVDSPVRRRMRNAFGGAASLMLIVLGAYLAWYASRWDRMAPPRP
jgi:hypothetical protein